MLLTFLILSSSVGLPQSTLSYSEKRVSHEEWSYKKKLIFFIIVVLAL